MWHHNDTSLLRRTKCESESVSVCVRAFLPLPRVTLRLWCVVEMSISSSTMLSMWELVGHHLDGLRPLVSESTTHNETQRDTTRHNETQVSSCTPSTASDARLLNWRRIPRGRKAEGVEEPEIDLHKPLVAIKGPTMG
ncbi:hypothetical protein EYF80_015459 [Liparis tanakae]|uniref:Uncharacterized protein n=1 Tax=Liparis tanakae TaxID=230148 RepID=A0A4Z2I840_9TELE|nr:hypothetical protein EYF80_015459 [Liparis tanakae]